MYPIGWFAIMTALCVVYARRANTVLGPQKHFYIDWSHAVGLVLVVMVVGFFVAQPKPKVETTTSTKVSGKSKTTTTSIYSYPSAMNPTKPRVKTYTEKQKEKKAKEKAEKEEKAKALQAKARQKAQTQAIFAFHAIGMTFAIFAGLILWRQEVWYPYALALASMCCVVSYYWWSSQHELSNVVLVMVAVGFSLLGRLTTKRGFVVAYVLLVLFDIYAVWGSRLMSQISMNYPGSFPKFLMSDTYAGLWTGIGAGDVIFAAIACNHIHQHRGVRRSALFALLCTMSLPWGFLSSTGTPLLIFVAPLAIAILLYPEGKLRID